MLLSPHVRPALIIGLTLAAIQQFGGINLAMTIVAINVVDRRGTNAMRLVLGVVLGIVTGELTVAGLGGGYLPLAVATFVAMAIAKTVGGTSMVVGQAAASAILTVAVAGGDAGINRLIDALIGTGIVLIFSQLLFAPKPLALLRRVEATALKSMADGFALTAEAVECRSDAASGDSAEDAGEEAIATFRQTRGRLADLGRTRQTSPAVARRSLPWRRRAAPVIQENEDAASSTSWEEVPSSWHARR